jgi:hypothetical protein
MKKEFPRIGVNDGEAGKQLLWTLGWAFVVLAISIFSIFQP